MKLHYLFLLFGFSLFAQDVETLSWDKAMINEKVPMTRPILIKYIKKPTA
jgi:hypothetical protein